MSASNMMIDRRLRPRTLHKVGKTAKTASKPQSKLQQVKPILQSDFQLSKQQQTTKQRSSLRLKQQQQDRKTASNPSN